MCIIDSVYTIQECRRIQPRTPCIHLTLYASPLLTLSILATCSSIKCKQALLRYLFINRYTILDTIPRNPYGSNISLGRVTDVYLPPIFIKLYHYDRNFLFT